MNAEKGGEGGCFECCKNDSRVDVCLIRLGRVWKRRSSYLDWGRSKEWVDSIRRVVYNTWRRDCCNQEGIKDISPISNAKGNAGRCSV